MMNDKKTASMRPITPDIMERLAGFITADGGARLLTAEDRCVPKAFKAEGPTVKQPYENSTCGCGGMSRAVVELRPALVGDPDPPEEEHGFATFCVNCDGAHYWPRFDEICVEHDD